MSKEDNSLRVLPKGSLVFSLYFCYVRLLLIAGLPLLLSFICTGSLINQLGKLIFSFSASENLYGIRVEASDCTTNIQFSVYRKP